MAKVACGLWIPFGTRPAAAASVVRLGDLVADQTFARSMWITDTRPIGGRQYPSGNGLDFYWEGDRDVAGAVAVLDGFGWVPDPCPLALALAKSGDHPLLAEVAAFLAGETGGVIDLCGRLQEAAKLPGRAVEAQLFDTGYRRTYLDAVAMRAHARNPRCRMFT